MADYFDPIEAEILRAKETDPEVVFPWTWWKERARSVGMSPNAVYTRAVKSGLYVPPPKREPDMDSPSENGVEGSPYISSSSPEEAPATDRSSETSPATDISPSSPPPRRSIPETKTRGERSSGDPAPAAPSLAAVGSGGLSDSIQGLASLFATAMDQQVRDLNQALEQSREENRRLRQALQQMEELNVKMSEIYRSTLYSSTD